MVAGRSVTPGPERLRLRVVVGISLVGVVVAALLVLVTSLFDRWGPTFTFLDMPMALNGNGALIVLVAGVPGALAAGWTLIALVLSLGRPLSRHWVLRWLGAGLAVLGAIVLVSLFPVPGRTLLDVAVSLVIVGVLSATGLTFASAAGRLNHRAVITMLGTALVLFVALLPASEVVSWLGPVLPGPVVAVPVMFASRRSATLGAAWPTRWLVAADFVLLLSLIFGVMISMVVHATIIARS